MTARFTWLPKREPCAPPDHDDDVIYAARALAAGKANEGQQLLFWEWLMYVTGNTDRWADLSYRPESQRATDFAEGKRFVGLRVCHLLHPALTPVSGSADPGSPSGRPGGSRGKQRRRKAAEPQQQKA